MQFLTVHVCMPISVHVEAREGYQLYHTITLFLAYSLRECLYMNQKLNILAAHVGQQAPRVCLPLPLYSVVTGTWPCLTFTCVLEI